ncbi:gephyrin-like molybdotransferase Glp [Hoeflea prorocentri]|uniref:Molybdopterin molybdenumtransferase n=1 Tax=Hoeflea prorocentri TaxID=1922333 RepID=A0A9X3UH29_9HYPH|nr:gephyrin-like molybdotransferase Glp [Hoeflea prorocentri]MCY6380708.1 molybdopterin molybdotransferase MoeA [Hoeflea prorocentri]MDA5398508.1 molybdopterin molybdotransferase MoeA [Hoeflea prorocentri]
MSLVPVEEARSRILDGIEPITSTETVTLAQAIGRQLAADLKAGRSQPPFPASAMDGYAVRAADVTTVPTKLTVIGEAPAGHGFSGTVEKGEAVRIFTGAPVPSGADTIVIQENTERLDDRTVRIDQTVSQGTYVRPEGLDFATGDTVLHAGQILDAGRITVAAAMNCPELVVKRQPRVAILATGDELVPPGSTPGMDQIIASNGFGVRAIAEADGAAVTDLGIAADRQDIIEAAIDRALEIKADILITLGGASVGKHDLVQKALVARGMKLDFWRIAMRPGKPLMYGELGALHVLGLPGNPVSSLVCSHLFLRPLIARLSGVAEHDPHSNAVLGSDVAANDQRQDYLRAKLARNADGTLVATPFERQDSSMTRIFAESDCLIIRPPHAKAASSGDACRIVLLRAPA